MALLKTFIITILLIVSSATAKEVNVSILLRSIAEVESMGRPEMIGQAGERSEYQFMAATWKQYSKVPHRTIGQEKNHNEVVRVAKKHIETIKKSITEYGKEVTPFRIALAWNAGPDRLSFQSRHRDYAQRVSNLYETYSAALPPPKTTLPVFTLVCANDHIPTVFTIQEQTVFTVSTHPLSIRFETTNPIFALTSLR
jgi:hypothetical protein